MEDKTWPYSEEVEDFMLTYYENLAEKNKRYYAAVEAQKLGHGGISYISELFDISERTIRRGIEELKKKAI